MFIELADKLCQVLTSQAPAVVPIQTSKAATSGDVEVQLIYEELDTDVEYTPSENATTPGDSE
jgi:hypothetical protein